MSKVISAHTDGSILISRETITTEYKYTIDDIKKYVTNFKRSHSGYPGVSRPAAYDRAMNMLCSLIRRYRSDIMANNAPYQIITNGYGEFLRVETEEFGVNANKVFSLLKELVK